MTFRPDTPSSGPSWLPRFADSVGRLFRQILPVPLRLFHSTTANLPDAAEYLGGIAWDETEENLTFSDGADWLYWSFSDHVHAASAITNTPTGGIAATNVQAALNELDSEKAPTVHSHAISDVTGLQAALDGKQSLDATLTALAGASWSAGSQVLTLSAADTVTLVTVGQAAGNILNKAAGDALYQPLDGDLTAIAGLTSAADKVPYFTGAGTAAVADFTSVARTLVAQTTQALMRSTGLGLGTAAVKDTGTSGDTVALLNGVNTWSANTVFEGVVSLKRTQPVITLDDTDTSGASADGRILFRDSALATNAQIDYSFTTSGAVSTLIAGTARLAVSSAGIDVTGLVRCDTFRIDQTPTAETITPTHTIVISVNGTNYRIPCRV